MKIITPYFTAFLIFCGLLQSCNQINTDAPQQASRDTLKIIKGNEYISSDQSPLDISYFPNEYPQNKLSGNQNIISPVARVIYSRPHKKGRIIFGNDEKSLCHYGKPWRLGANEATEIEFFVPVIINNKNIQAGRYVLYCIPFEDKWIISLNNNLDSWGLQIDPAQDVLRTEVPVQQQSPSIEDFTIIFVSTNYGADLLLTWDNVKVFLPINFSK